jgi:hypothetical protein
MNNLIAKIYLQIDRIAIKGNTNYLEYYKYIDDCILNGNYDNLLQCLFLYYEVDLRKIEVANDLKKYWDTILSFTLNSFDKKLKKLYTNKKVYQLGQKIYDDSDDSGKLYGEIIELEVYTPEQKYYLKNKEYAKITKTITTNLVVNRIDGEVLILDTNDSTSYDANLYNKYAQAITFLLSYVPAIVIPTFYMSEYNTSLKKTSFFSIDEDDNLIPLNLFIDDLEGYILIANNYDDNLTYFINNDLNGNILFGQLNSDGSIESIPLDLPDSIDDNINSDNTFYYDGNDSFIYLYNYSLPGSQIQNTFRIHINGSVESVNINDITSANIYINNLFKSNDINYTLSLSNINSGNIPINAINISQNIGDVIEDDIEILTTVNNLPIDMYKLLFLFSSVVVNDKTYCLYFLVNKENSASLSCIAELNLDTYEGDWIQSINYNINGSNTRPLQLITNL